MNSHTNTNYYLPIINNHIPARDPVPFLALSPISLLTLWISEGLTQA